MSRVGALIVFGFLAFILVATFYSMWQLQQRLIEGGVITPSPGYEALSRAWNVWNSAYPVMIQALSHIAIVFSVAVVIWTTLRRMGGAQIQAVGEQDIMDLKDYYSLLGVGRDAKVEEIKQAYKRLVKKYHPDISGHPMAEEIMKAANAAREILTDPVKRRRYDEALASKSLGFRGVVRRHSSHHHGRRVCLTFSAIPAALIFLIVVNLLIHIPSSLSRLSAPPPDGWIAPLPIASIPVFAFTVWTASRSAYTLIVKGALYLLLIIAAIFLIGLGAFALMVFIMARAPALPPFIASTASTFPVFLVQLVAAASHFMMQLIVDSLRQAGIAYPLISMSFLSAAAVWWDKRQASLMSWRISEAALKRMAITGGGLAMLIACLMLRHKIRKRGFMLAVITASVINIVTMWLVAQPG